MDRTSLPKRRSALLLELIRAKEQCDDSGCPEDLPSSMHMRMVNVLKEMLSVISLGLQWSLMVSAGLRIQWSSSPGLQGSLLSLLVCRYKLAMYQATCFNPDEGGQWSI